MCHIFANVAIARLLRGDYYFWVKLHEVLGYIVNEVCHISVNVAIARLLCSSYCFWMKYCVKSLDISQMKCAIYL